MFFICVLTVRSTFFVFPSSEEEERFFRHLCSVCYLVGRASTGDVCFASRATSPSSSSPRRQAQSKRNHRDAQCSPKLALAPRSPRQDLTICRHAHVSNGQLLLLNLALLLFCCFATWHFLQHKISACHSRARIWRELWHPAFPAICLTLVAAILISCRCATWRPFLLNRHLLHHQLQQFLCVVVLCSKSGSLYSPH